MKLLKHTKFTYYLSATFLACTPFVFVHPIRVSGDSMAPTLKDGQVVLALWSWCSGKPNLGEIRVLNSPEGNVIKRVLALPGHELEQHNGYLTRDGVFVEEPYVYYREIRNSGPWQAGDGYLLFGDNRQSSRDCRLWGSVYENMVRGRIVFH